MLDSITLKFTQHDDLVLPAAGITIFVGPNNSGKSLILKEVEQAFLVHPFPSNLLVLKDYEIKWPEVEDVKSNLTKFDAFQDKSLPVGHKTIGRINPNGGREATTLNIPHLLGKVCITRATARVELSQLIQ